MPDAYNSVYTGRQVDRAVGAYLSGTVIPIDDIMSDTSTNPVENKIAKAYIDNALARIPIGDEVRY